MKMSVDQVKETLLSHYHSKFPIKRRLIVGIDGLGGAGKTTFTQKLRDELKLVSGNLTRLLLNSMKLWG
jgi:uridine kinase